MHSGFVSTEELGALMGLTRQTIRNWIKKGQISANSEGPTLKIPQEEAVRILNLYELPVPKHLLKRKTKRSRAVKQTSTQGPTNSTLTR